LILAAMTATSVVALTSCRTAEPPTDTPALQRQTSVNDAATLGIGEKFALPPLLALDGRTLEPAEVFRGRRAVAIVMTSTGCPLSRKYGPRLAAVEREYAAPGKDVAFVYVNTVEAETDQHMRDQAREYGFRGPYLPDRDRAVASTFGVRTTTEVFVLDRDSRLVYRGAVDDQYGVGTSRSAPSANYLRDALDAAIAGTADSLAVKATFAPGCLVDVPRKRVATNLTYFGSAAHILADNCVACHTQGGVAPFSLATYPDILGRVSMIEAVVRDGLMPPSHGRVMSDLGEFASPRQMSDRERADLLAWLGSEHAMGSFAEGPAPIMAGAEWAVGGGRPDYLFITPTLRLPADGPLVHKRSVMRLPVERDEWVREFEFRPIKPDTVHHALVWILPRGVEPPADDAMPEGLELLGVFSPAQSIVRYPEGVARRLPEGCSLLVDLYAQPMGREMMSSLRMAIALGDTPREEVRSVVVQASDLHIQPGLRDQQFQAAFELKNETTVLSIFPNMRSRGRSLRLAFRGGFADSAEPTLLDAPNFDFRWQLRFEFEVPRMMGPNTQLRLTGTFDNSAANPNNPNPAQTVHAGPGAADESLLAVLEALVPVEGRERRDN
jgi:mono/diheme cytochrome c family protein